MRERVVGRGWWRGEEREEMGEGGSEREEGGRREGGRRGRRGVGEG